MEHERLVISHDIVTNYVKHMLIGFEIRRVHGEGLCTLHAFVEDVTSIKVFQKNLTDETLF